MDHQTERDFKHVTPAQMRRFQVPVQEAVKPQPSLASFAVTGCQGLGCLHLDSWEWLVSLWLIQGKAEI